MLYEPLAAAHGNQFMVMRRMPGMHMEVIVIHKVRGDAAFNADARPLRKLTQTVTGAADVAVQAIRAKPW